MKDPCIVEGPNGRKVIWTTRKDIAEQCFFLKGKPFSLDEYPPFHAIYECTNNYTVLVSGRQVSKSTSAANFGVAECIGQGHWDMIAVLPTVMQMRRFSNQRIGKVINESPIVRKWFVDNTCKRNTYERSFLNGSTMFFGALSQIESLRGLSGNRILEDEVQDMVSDDLPIVEEALSGQPSDKQFIMRTGTAKTVGNLLETTYRKSTMCEWIVVCPAGHHNIPSAENIANHGFVCKRCKERCDVRNGYWRAFADIDRKWAGFRIPQIILPMHTEDPVKWEEIVRKKHEVDPITFQNEVMGQAAGSGIDFLSEDHLRECCEPSYEPYMTHVPPGERFQVKLATIDWGSARKSHTVVAIWGMDPMTNRLKLLYAEKVASPDPFKQVDIIAAIIQAFGVHVVGADWGYGWVSIPLLEHKIGRNVTRFMYVTEQRELAKYDQETTIWKVNRSQAMSEAFLKMRKKEFWFPNWRSFFHRFAVDILCIFMEPIVDRRTMNDKFKYDHPEDQPDDFAHCAVYANLLMHLLRFNKI